VTVVTFVTVYFTGGNSVTSALFQETYESVPVSLSYAVLIIPWSLCRVVS